MTNDVKSIKNENYNNSLYFRAKMSYIQGDLSKAKELLDESLAHEIIITRQNSSFSGAYDTEFNSLLLKYSRVYEIMRLEMPDFSNCKEMLSVPN